MKTAISIPDDTFDRVHRLAKQHRMNRSQFFTEAASRYADSLESAELTAAIDASLDAAGSDESTQFAVAAGRMLPGDDEEPW